MKILSVLTIAATLATTPSLAANQLFIAGFEDANNVLALDVSGDNNAIGLVQTHDGLGAANTIQLAIDGNLNGGPAGSVFSGYAAFAGLTPGSITQLGHDNHMAIDVNGNNNLFAFAQNGSRNQLTASITGSYNQAAVSQTGIGNYVNFTQNGTGNMLSVVQTSW